jgi:ferritin-like metal-binding protein YciE
MLAFEVLPQVLEEAQSEWLVRPLEEHLVQTRSHTGRVQRVFGSLGVEASSNLSQPLEGLRRQHDELAPKFAESRLKDIFLAAAAARTEHLELALYTSLLQLAPQVGADSQPLEENKREEEHALREVERSVERLREHLPV